MNLKNHMPLRDNPKKLKKIDCPTCWRNQHFCICNIASRWKHEVLSTKLPFSVLILEHPQEIKNPFNTSRLVSLMFEETIHRIGLSWPSFESAIGKKGIKKSLWPLLYPKMTSKNMEKVETNTHPIHKDTTNDSFEGIIILDGSWKEVKTLLWRNKWLLKHPVYSMHPTRKSHYHQLQREPKKNYLSTFEAFTYFFNQTKESSTEHTLTSLFPTLITYWMDQKKTYSTTQPISG